MFVPQILAKYIRMGITSLDIKNNLYVNHDKIINIQDFNSEKLSVIKDSNNKTHVYYDHNLFFFFDY